MEVALKSPDLAFLDGSTAESHLPIRVIQAARRRYNIIKAMPKPEIMPLWKSLDYRTEPSRGKGYCSISVIEDWRMELCSDQQQKQPTVHILSIRGASND